MVIWPERKHLPQHLHPGSNREVYMIGKQKVAEKQWRQCLKSCPLTSFLLLDVLDWLAVLFFWRKYPAAQAWRPTAGCRSRPNLWCFPSARSERPRTERPQMHACSIQTPPEGFTHIAGVIREPERQKTFYLILALVGATDWVIPHALNNRRKFAAIPLHVCLKTHQLVFKQKFKESWHKDNSKQPITKMNLHHLSVNNRSVCEYQTILSAGGIPPGEPSGWETAFSVFIKADTRLLGWTDFVSTPGKWLKKRAEWRGFSLWWVAALVKFS